MLHAATAALLLVSVLAQVCLTMPLLSVPAGENWVPTGESREERQCVHPEASGTEVCGWESECGM